MPKKTKIAKGKIVLALIMAAAIILSVGIPFALEYRKMKASEMQKYYEGWLPENCQCLERNRSVCGNQSFSVEGSYCVNKSLKLVTNVVKSCSKYDCSGSIYDFEINKGVWSVEKDG